MTASIQVLVGTPDSGATGVVVTGPDVTGSTATSGGTATTSNTSMTVTGGTGTYSSFAWSFVSGDSGITINSPTTKNTTFSATVNTVNPSKSAVYQLLVTDSGSNTGSTQINVTLTYTGP